MKNLFDLTGKVAIITGGVGFMGVRHAEILALYGAIPVLIDLPASHPETKAKELASEYNRPIDGLMADVTKPTDVQKLLQEVLARYGRVDILINNAANNPTVNENGLTAHARFENLPLHVWNEDLAVALTGSFLCCQIIGTHLAEQHSGVILNVASDLSVISPDQRLYRQAGVPENEQPVKPVTYSVAKTGLIGLTRYLATYWADCGVRVNAISPGGVYKNQSVEFVHRLTQLIPMGRMASSDEWQGTVLFLCSDASSYVTGINVVIDGGRSCL
jgi:NAD(P)-dependent dehydrogenase (short-subunit alcohol dehydrogenase family)